MNHTITQLAPCRQKIECSFEPGEVDQVINDIYAELGKEVEVRGFRRGRAPREILVRRFGKGVAQDAGAKLIAKGLESLTKEKVVRPFGETVITPTDPEAFSGETFTFQAEMDVRPEFELAEYKGLTLSTPPVEPTQEAIDAQLRDIQEQFAAREESREPAAPGNRLEVDTLVQVGERILAQEKDQWLENSGETLMGRPCPGLTAALTGARVGDDLHLTIQLPEDHPDETLRNAEASVTLTVKKILIVALPELNDELARRCSLESLDELKKRVAELVGRKLVDACYEAMESQIRAQLLAKMPFDLPAAQVERQGREIEELQHMAMAREGHSSDSLSENRELIKTLSREQAEKELRWAFIREAIAREEKISVNPEELQTYINNVARRLGESSGKWLTSPDGEAFIERSHQKILNIKVITFLIDNSIKNPLPPDGITPGTTPE